MLGAFAFLGQDSGMTTPTLANLQTFMLADTRVYAQDCVKGFFVNPVMHAEFDSTPNTERDFEDMIWWMRPFIVGEPGAWSVRILDGGAWDRSSWVSDHTELDEAVKACQELVLKPRFIAKATPLPGMEGGFAMTPLEF